MGYIHILIPLLEIVVMAIALNYLLCLFWNSKSLDLIWAVFGFIILYAIVTYFNLPVLHKIMLQLGSAALIGFVILFQPELRLALSRFSLKGKRYKEISEFDKFLDQLANSIYRLAEKRIGALIALENEDSLDEYARKAVVLNGDFSSEFLETIFATTTPLHDGAIIIRDRTILSAACILPLAEDSSQLTKSMGTRHRAALGLSNITDALIIVISEESGKVSIARDSIMTRGIKIDRFKGIIRSIFNPPNKISFQNKFNLKEWLKR
ncbi:MAG: Cyclic di-AMP synthase CdaA [Candidatus Anoxychlamydiales bacterium]|nr:Cyclic di-AMP synthase CdaA [Candidatus Anoxychlamydiales bacterium]